MTMLDQQIVDALARVRNPGGSKVFDINTYGAAFHNSAQEKARTVLDLLNKQDCPFRGQKPIFVSIGGADAVELDFYMKNSSATVGILLESNRHLAQAARDRSAALASINRKIVVIEGDAQAKIAEIMDEALRQLKHGAGAFVAVTCHAVLHELFDRGPNFDPIEFFSSIFFDEQMPLWFTYREPGRPEKWPGRVFLSADCSPENLISLAQAITSRHRIFADLAPAPKNTGGKVMMNSTLAMEVLAKLFYIEDLDYEIDERSTSVNHNHLINALNLAIGEEPQKNGRSALFSASSPTDSFRRLWMDNKIQLLGVNEDWSTYSLPIPESHTRVIAWRSPPPASPSDPDMNEVRARDTTDALTVCRTAMRQNDLPLMEACLSNSGRYWIESSAKDDARRLFKEIVRSAPDSLAGVLAHFLDALPDLFNDQLAASEFTEEAEVRAAKYGLGLLLRAERMEYARKTGDVSGAIRLANTLVIDAAAYKAIKPIERYQHATVLFLLANLLREGGRYAEALTFIEQAQSIYLVDIPSHNTELAHCEYASLSCRAMRGDASLKGSGYRSIGQEHRFASALIQLSFAHAAWLLNDPGRAMGFAREAARGFGQIHFDGHAQRAESTRGLLATWQQLENGQTLDTAAFPVTLANALRGITGAKENLGDAVRFVEEQRPGRALGFLQFARDNSAVLDQELDIKISPLIEIANTGWRLKTNMRVRSLREADQILRKEMGIEPGQKIPLLP